MRCGRRLSLFGHACGVVSPLGRRVSGAALILGLLSALVLGPSVHAQPSRHDDAGDNFGTWTWGSSPPARPRDFPDDDYAGTSWEQMYEERLYEEELERESEPEQISPLRVPAKIWRFFRPEKDAAE